MARTFQKTAQTFTKTKKHIALNVQTTSAQLFHDSAWQLSAICDLCVTYFDDGHAKLTEKKWCEEIILDTEGWNEWDGGMVTYSTRQTDETYANKANRFGEITAASHRSGLMESVSVRYLRWLDWIFQ